MNADIIALFAEHGPMTVSEAMTKGLGRICGTCNNYNARHHLNQLVNAGHSPDAVRAVRCGAASAATHAKPTSSSIR